MIASVIISSLYILAVAFELTTANVDGNEQHHDPRGNRASSSSKRAGRALNEVAAQDATGCPSGYCDDCPLPPSILFEELLCTCTVGCPLVVGCKIKYDGKPGCRLRQQAIDECARRDSCRGHGTLNQTIGLKVFVGNGTLSALPSETVTYPFGHNLFTTASHNQTGERGSSDDIMVNIAIWLTPAVVLILLPPLVYMIRRRNAKTRTAGNTTSLTGNNSAGNSNMLSMHVEPSNDSRTEPQMVSNETYSAVKELASPCTPVLLGDVESRLDRQGNADTEPSEGHALLPLASVQN